jgi:S-formylglutathione hydrolase
LFIETHMTTLQCLSQHFCFGGVQGFYAHACASTQTQMKFGVFVPPQAENHPVPILFFLAGLTCTEETFAIKAGAQQYAAQHGIMLVTPDTSPRQTGVSLADAHWTLGHGASFYLDATLAPWSTHWQMASYLTQELRGLVLENFAGDADRVGIMGHSMGGHGALTLALKHPRLFQSVSALAPLVAPTQCPWGVNALRSYLGENSSAWAEHDATELVKNGAKTTSPILIDQGLHDPFLTEQLQPDLFEAACQAKGQSLILRHHEKFDHGYYFVSSFIADHVAHHAQALAWGRH